MTKVAIKSDKITSLGGIFHVMDVFSKLGLNQIIDSSLGQRGSTSTAFQYSDIISSLFYSYLCTRVRDKKRLEKVGNLVKNSYLYR